VDCGVALRFAAAVHKAILPARHGGSVPTAFPSPAVAGPSYAAAMPRKLSAIAPDWWDYTTLNDSLIRAAAALTPARMARMSRPGFRVVFYDTLEEFYLAEALEYLDAWRQSTDDNPAGICGPIGPTEQLPLVARLVNALGLDVRSGHFWGMDEWFDTKTRRAVPVSHPLSFERCDRELCFNRIDRRLRMPDSHLHFPKADVRPYRASWDAGVRCVVMQGGQGDVKHWAFNDPLPRRGRWRHAPPAPAEYLKLATRVVELHPLTIAQNARTSGGGNIALVPTRAISVGPAETWRAEKVSIWHAGTHDNPFGQRLTCLMIAEKIVDTAVPMSLLALHPNVQFNYYRGGLGACDVRMR
jgi:glucosamine-6-phosphate deaminase